VSRCETRVGSFEAPVGWTLLGEVGVVEGAPPAADAEPVFRRSIVLSGDVPLEGRTPAEYLATQQHLLAEMLPGFEALEARAPDAVEGAVGLLGYRFAHEEGEELAQRQAYFFEPRRIAVLTLTLRADAPADDDVAACFTRAVESFVFAKHDPEGGRADIALRT
jgi:hypothetical protein